MKRYFRCTISWNREEASEVEAIDMADNISQEDAEVLASEDMWDQLVGNNVDSWTREITKEEYYKENAGR